MRTVEVCDLFCGAGGSSTGLQRAADEFGVPMRLTAVNHWDVAIATHSANHPEHRHWCEDIDTAKPFKIVPEGHLDILWASPSCTEHSYAKGGGDVDDQKRASAWAIPRMVEALRPRVVVVENVRPFLKWGPVQVSKTGKVRPIASRRGETFRAWCAAIESLGYTCSWNLLNAADYGEPQTRVRLFVTFVSNGVRWRWPEPSHARPDSLEVSAGTRLPWVAARRIIDWALPSQSIFARERPLSPNTMRRIEAGIRRYCAGPLAEAFLVVLRKHADAQSCDDPTPTVTAGGTHIGIAEPTLTPFIGANRTNNEARDVADPIATVTTATGGGLFLAQPTAFVLGQHGGSEARSVDQPIPTVTTDGYTRVFTVDVRHGEDDMRMQLLDDPLATVTAKNGVGIVEPFISSYEREGDGIPSRPRSLDEPLGTIVTRDRFAVVEPFITSYYGDGDGGEHQPRSTDDPLPTVTTASRFGVVEPFLAAHFGERDGQEPRTHAVTEPLPTVTHRGAGDLVEPIIAPAEPNAPGRVVEIDGKPYVLDVRFRMLQPHELALAQGFPAGYVFTGSKAAQTAQIGNAVPVGVAHALGRAALYALGYRETAESVA
ncbi:MAG: cytosine-specific methylase [Candidatus Eremiobacteraeota bacterium]|nr:cytosine-specific methylase [Candidatus Eremiobacteraeota bacterium]